MKSNKRKSLADHDIVTETRRSRRRFLAKVGPLGLAAVAAALGGTSSAADGSDNDRAKLADPKLPRDVNNDDRDVPWNDNDTWQPSDLRDGDRFR